MKELSKEQLEALKAKHGDVFQITVGDKCCYVKKPSRKALGFASMAAKENPLKFNEVILNESWLDGDEEIREDGQSDRPRMGNAYKRTGMDKDRGGEG